MKGTMHGSSTPRLVAAVFAVSFSGCIVQQAPPKNQERAQQAPQSGQQQVVAQNTKPAPSTKAAVAPTPAPKQSAPAPVAPAPTAPAAGRTYTIKPGDNLWNISKEVYGDATKYQRIIDANPGINPDNMKPGTKIVIP